MKRAAYVLFGFMVLTSFRAEAQAWHTQAKQEAQLLMTKRVQLERVYQAERQRLLESFNSCIQVADRLEPYRACKKTLHAGRVSLHHQYYSKFEALEHEEKTVANRFESKK